MLARLEKLQKDQLGMKDQMRHMLGEKLPEKEKDKMDLILESLNKNFDKIATAIGTGGGGIGGGLGAGFRKVNGEHITSQLGYQKKLPKQKDAMGRPVPPPAVPIPRHLLPKALGGLWEDPRVAGLSGKEALLKE